jgi:DNA-binding SARP family transcriptional activator
MDDRTLPTRPTSGTNAPLRLYALGSPRVLVGDDEVRFATRHAAWALFSLALSDGNELGVDELCERLWPEASEGVLARRLATMTWQVRRGLGDGAWRVVRTRTALRLELDEVDSVDLVQVQSEAAEVLAAGGPAPASLLDALATPVLEPWSTLPWVAEVQRSCTELRSSLLAAAG